MTAIRDYLRQIAGYLILSVLVENLVAKKEYGPYIRLFLNLLLVLLFVSPILSISAERVGQTWLEAGAFFSEGTYLDPRFSHRDAFSSAAGIPLRSSGAPVWIRRHCRRRSSGSSR